MRHEHVLIVRLAGIGDVVMASCAARRLRELRPNARISWLTGATAAPLVERFADVDQVISLDERRLLAGSAREAMAGLLPVWNRLLRERIGEVVLLHLDRRYRFVVAPLLGARLWALEKGLNPLAGRYFGDECARLIEEGPGSRAGLPSRAAGAHATLGRLRDGETAGGGVKRPRVALVPGGARNVLREDRLRRWTVEHYAQVARALASNAEVVLIGDAADAWVRPAFEGTPVVDRLGAMTLVETLDFFRNCELTISHDTGPMHLARLAGSPLIALFGPTNPAERLPEDDRTVVFWGGADLACRPCYDGRNYAPCNDNVCLSGISPEVVVRAARAMLSRQNPDAGRRLTVVA